VAARLGTEDAAARALSSPPGTHPPPTPPCPPTAPAAVGDDHHRAQPRQLLRRLGRVARHRARAAAARAALLLVVLLHRAAGRAARGRRDPDRGGPLGADAGGAAGHGGRLILVLVGKGGGRGGGRHRRAAPRAVLCKQGPQRRLRREGQRLPLVCEQQVEAAAQAGRDRVGAAADCVWGGVMGEGRGGAVRRREDWGGAEAGCGVLGRAANQTYPPFKPQPLAHAPTPASPSVSATTVPAALHAATSPGSASAAPGRSSRYPSMTSIRLRAAARSSSGVSRTSSPPGMQERKERCASGVQKTMTVPVAAPPAAPGAPGAAAAAASPGVGPPAAAAGGASADVPAPPAAAAAAARKPALWRDGGLTTPTPAARSCWRT
jgi:hypothetical protein